MSRLLLIPEDLYTALAATSSAGTNDGSPLQMIKSRMKRIVDDHTTGVDEKAIQYDQQFKRYNKLNKEREEQPVNVRLQNLEEIANAVPTLSAPVPAVTAGNTRRKTNQLNVKQKRRYANVKSKTKRSKNANKDGQAQEAENEPAAAAGTSSSQAEVERPHTRSKDPPVGKELERNATLTRQGVLTYIRQNAGDLNVNEEGRVLRSGTGKPMTTSNIETIVNYLLEGTEKNRFKNPPVGLADFILRANHHPLLVKYFFPEQYKKQQQEGKGFSSFKKVHKKSTISFSFKPSLWQ